MWWHALLWVVSVFALAGVVCVPIGLILLRRETGRGAKW